MKNPKSLIIKIALGVAAAAFIFSIVTLIRNIVIGAMIFISIIQVIGAAVIVIICFAMLRVFSGMDEEDEGEDERVETEVSNNEYEVTESQTEPSFDDFSDPQGGEPAFENKYDFDLFDE